MENKEKKPRIFATSFASVYPLYVQKAVRKGRTQEEVDEVITWLTGYTAPQLQQVISEPVLTTTSHLAQVEAVRAGLGVAVLARPLMQLAPELVEVPVELPELPSVPLWLVTLRSLRALPRIDALWSFLETRLVAQLKPHIKRRAPPRS
jgi:DNA-binding transcriptional LysR family regulator